MGTLKVSAKEHWMACNHKLHYENITFLKKKKKMSWIFHKKKIFTPPFESVWHFHVGSPLNFLKIHFFSRFDYYFVWNEFCRAEKPTMVNILLVSEVEFNIDSKQLEKCCLHTGDFLVFFDFRISTTYSTRQQELMLIFVETYIIPVQYVGLKKNSEFKWAVLLWYANTTN